MKFGIKQKRKEKILENLKDANFDESKSIFTENKNHKILFQAVMEMLRTANTEEKRLIACMAGLSVKGVAKTVLWKMKLGEIKSEYNQKSIEIHSQSINKE